MCTSLKVFVFILVTIFLCIFCYYKWSYQFWKKRKFPYIVPTIPVGSFWEFSTNVNPAVKLQHAYEIVEKQNLKYAGYFLLHMPRIIITCPQLMENILQTDFRYFTDRGFYYNKKDDPLSANLFAIGGDEWRIVRNKLSSSFTLGKLKAMFPIIKKCGFELKNLVHSKCDNSDVINMQDIAESYFMSVIASCGFGIESNSFAERSEFKEQGKKIFKMNYLRYIKMIFAFTYTDKARKVGITLFDQDTTKFFTGILKETIKLRKESNIVRHDIINSIIELGSDFDENEIKNLAAQVFIFFSAGYETTSLTLTYCLYELSINIHLQERLRHEIKSVLSNHNGEVTYEALSEMKYMDQIINETLRKYPPLPYITRMCVKDYRIPNTDHIIPKGANLDFSILALHYNSKYYDLPHKFDPERFSKESFQLIDSRTYMPFGAGPRKCIGMKLGLLNVKLALTMMLNNHRFTLNEKTKQPIGHHAFSLTLLPRHKILLNSEIDNSINIC